MKKLILSLLFLSTLYSANSLLDDLISEQSSVVYELSDLNVTEADTNAILDKRLQHYSQFLNTLMKDPNESLQSFTSYSQERFRLQRKIDINAQRGNTYAVFRDKIKITTLQVKSSLQDMLEGLIASTNESSFKKFKTSLDLILQQNKTDIENLHVSYKEELLTLDPSSALVIEAKTNLKDLTVLIELNNGLRKYILAYEKSIYQSQVYSNYGFSFMKEYINKTGISKTLDPLLKGFHLDTSRLLLIIIILMFTLSASRVFYWLINLVLEKSHYEIEGIQFILHKVRNIVRILIILFGIEIIFNVYLGIGEQADESGKFFQMSYIILSTYLVYKVANAIAIIKMQSIHKRTKKFRNEVINLSIKAINFIIILIGFLIILNVYGFDLTTILSGLGIGSLAVAFAAKDTLANFFGSLSILLDNPFSQGDWIEVETYQGTVIEIGIRSTTIRTFENGMITIPNLTLASSAVINWSKRELGRRIKMSIGVTYESNFGDIRNAVEDIKNMLLTHKDIASQETEFINKNKELKLISKEDQVGVKRLLYVNLENFSASSIDIMVYCFAKSTAWEDWLNAKEDVMYKIADILKVNNLSFAYPALSVHLNQDQTSEKE